MFGALVQTPNQQFCAIEGDEAAQQSNHVQRFFLPLPYGGHDIVDT